MAILRSADGKFYELDDNLLQGREVKPKDLPADLRNTPPPDAGGGARGMGGLVRIIINAPPVAGAPPPQSATSEGEGDVAGHSGWHNNWANYQNPGNPAWKNWVSGGPWRNGSR